MSFLIDTDVAIHLRDGDSVMIAKLARLSMPPMLSVVTLVELEGGVHARPEHAEKRRAAIDALLSELTVLDFDRETAEAYGRIVAAIRYSRRKVVDRMIAATALVHDLTLITINGGDFTDIPDLKLAIWNASEEGPITLPPSATQR